MRLPFTLILICACLTAFAQRIGNSPYPPITATPDTLYTININGMTNSQQLTVVTLQGLLAKTKPRIMVQRGTKFFQDALAISYGVTYDTTYQNNFAGLIAHFATSVSGYILCGLNDTTTNAAISACSSRTAIAVIAADTAVMRINNIPMLLSTVGKSQSWAYDSLGITYSDRIVGFQDPTKCTDLSDYSIFSGAFHFSDAMQSPLTTKAFNHMQVNSALLGWGSENTLVSVASQHGIHVHAADFASNLSTYTNFQATALQHIHSSDTTVMPGTHTVCFIMTDGDNIQWLLGDFADNTNWYGSPDRGIVPIGWTVSPALAELAPTVLKCLYDSARSGTGSDYFIAGPSGMGYQYPDYFSYPDSAAAISARMMQKADLSIVNVIGDAYEPEDLTGYFAQPNIDGMFYYTFDAGYTGLRGFSTCVNNKPFISARYTLWNSYASAPTLAAAIKALPKDPTIPDSYTLVSVHVWDHNVDSVIASVQLFDSTIRVVSPDAFVKLFKKGTGCRIAGLGTNDIQAADALKLHNVPNPCIDKTDIVYELPERNFLQVKLYDQSGKEVKTIFTGVQDKGKQKLTLDTHDLAAGSYTYMLAGGSISASGRCEVVR